MRLHNRQVKADFWRDGELAKWTLAKRLIYIGLIQLSDDSGCFNRDDFAVKQYLFAENEEVKLKKIGALIDELIENGKLIPYVSDKKDCLFLKNFHKHQKLNMPSPPETPLPAWVQYEVTEVQRSNGKTYSVGKYLVGKPYGNDVLINVTLKENQSDIKVTSKSHQSDIEVTLPLEKELEKELEPEPEREKEEEGFQCDIENPPPPGRPFLKKFIAEVWTPHFPNHPLLPTTYSVDTIRLDRLENAIARFRQQAGGVQELFDEIDRRIGPGGESKITGLRMKLQNDMAKVNRQWQQTVIPYLAAIIEGIYDEQEANGHDSRIRQQRENDKGNEGRSFRSNTGNHRTGAAGTITVPRGADAEAVRATKELNDTLPDVFAD